MAQKRRRKSNAPPFIKETLNGINESFFEAMRRPTTVGDRSFYWSYCYSLKEFKQITLRMLISANIPKHIIYIYDKTDLMVNEHGYRRLSKADKKLLKETRIEFDVLSDDEVQALYKLSDYNDAPIGGGDPLQNALYILGNFVERNFNAGTRLVDYQALVVGHLVVRAFRIVRAIFRSQSYSTAEEDFLLLRSLYEIYCKLCFACRRKRDAKYLFDSDFGLAIGEYEFLEKDGKIRRQVLVNKRTKKQIPRTRSFYKYASSSPYAEDVKFFEVFYEYLSSFVHSGSRHVRRTWETQRGFSLVDEEDENFKTFGLMLTCFISAMIMQRVIRLPNVSKISKWDVCLFCVVARGIILNQMATPENSEIADLLPKIKARAKRFPNKVPKLQLET